MFDVKRRRISGARSFALHMRFHRFESIDVPIGGSHSANAITIGISKKLFAGRAALVRPSIVIEEPRRVPMALRKDLPARVEVAADALLS